MTSIVIKDYVVGQSTSGDSKYLLLDNVMKDILKLKESDKLRIQISTRRKDGKPFVAFWVEGK